MQIVSMDVLGEAQYVRGFDVFAEEMQDMRQPLERIRDVIHQSVTDQFDTQGEHGGHGWTPLNDTYAAWKQANYPGQPILQRTGALHDALTDEYRATLELSHRRLVYGVNPSAQNDEGQVISEYGAIHQEGGDRVPQRKIFALSEQDRRRVDREVVEWINGRRHSLLPG